MARLLRKGNLAGSLKPSTGPKSEDFTRMTLQDLAGVIHKIKSWGPDIPLEDVIRLRMAEEELAARIQKGI